MAERQKARLWRGFWQLADPKIWVASTVPMAVGGALAYAHRGAFDWPWFLAGAAAVYCIEIGKNAVNEVVDWLSGVDRYVAPDKRTPFSGGKKTIVDGLLTVREAAIIAVAAMAAGAAIGLVVAFTREFAVLWFGLAGFFASIFYSLPPLQLAYRGGGEAAVGLTFGPLITCGTFLVQAGTVTLEVFLVSIPLGFLIAGVLWINQYPDYEADKRGGKMNGVVRLGKKKAGAVYALLLGGAYLGAAAVAVYSGNFFWFLAWLSLPLALRAIGVARRYYDDIPRLIEANAKTIQIYQLTGLTMIAAALLPQYFQ